MIHIVNRELQIPTNEQVIGVQGDNLTQKRVFSIDKIVNGIDLSTFTPLIQLQAIYPTHPPYFDILKVAVEGEKLNLTWNISDHNMSSKGKLYFQIQFSKVVGSEAVVYQTIKNVFIVAPTIEARAEYENMTPVVFEQYIAEAKAEADRAESIANGLIGRVDIAIENSNIQANYTKDVGDTLLQKLANGDFKGDKGDGLNLAGSFETLEELSFAFPNGDGANTYLIGVDVFVWNGIAWVTGGRIQGESAYEEAVLGGYTGTKEQFISDLNRIAPHISNKEIHITTLTHTKTGTVHNLVGIIPTSGIVTVNYLPTAVWEDGDSIAINSIPYAAYNTLGEPVSGFKTGIPVSAQINTTAKIIAIGGGGGKVKMVQQLELPLSTMMAETGADTAWITQSVVGQPLPLSSWYDKTSNCMYYAANKVLVNGVNKDVLYIQDMSTFSIETYAFAANAFVGYGGSDSYGLFRLFVHNGEVFTFNYSQDKDSSVGTGNVYIMKYNLTTLTYTNIKSAACNNSGVAASNGVRWRADICDIGDFISITFSSMRTNNDIHHVSIRKSTMSFEEIRFIAVSTGNYSSTFLTGVIHQTSNEVYILFRTDSTHEYAIISKITGKFLSRKICTNVALKTTFSGYGLGCSCVSFGDRVACFTQTVVVGTKRVCYIDAVNDTISPVEPTFPDVPASWSFGSYPLQGAPTPTVHLVGDDVVLQNIEQTHKLSIVPVDPASKPLVLKLFKGDKVNSYGVTIPVRALVKPPQPAFNISPVQQIAVQDLEIHLGQYGLQGQATQILIEKG